MVKEKKRKKQQEEEVASKKKSKESEQHTERSSKFVPSTKEDLKSYVKNAKRKEKDKKEGKNIKKDEPPNEKALAFKKELREGIPKESINKERFIARYVKIMREKEEAYKKNKDNDKRWAPQIPSYDINEPKEEYAESNFVYDIQTTIAHFSWEELNRLIAGGLGKKLKTQTFTKAFHTVEYMMNKVLGVKVSDDSVRYSLKDREATLKLWPAKTRSNEMVKKTEKTEKTSKKSVDKSEKKAKKAESKETKGRAKRSTFNEETKLSVVKKFEGGVREKAQSCIGDKASYGKVVRLAKKNHGLPEKKVKNYISWLVANGYVKVLS